MKDQTVLVKRSIEKDGLPPVDEDGSDKNFTIDVCVENDNGVLVIAYFNISTHEIHDGDSGRIMRHFKAISWYEKTTIQFLIESRMPMHDEIQKSALEKYPVHMDSYVWGWDDGNKDFREGYEQGQKDLINKLSNIK